MCPSNRSLSQLPTGARLTPAALRAVGLTLPGTIGPHPGVSRELHHPCSSSALMQPVGPAETTLFSLEAQMWRFLSCFLKPRVSLSRKEDKGEPKLPSCTGQGSPGKPGDKPEEMVGGGWQNQRDGCGLTGLAHTMDGACRKGKSVGSIQPALGLLKHRMVI